MDRLNAPIDLHNLSYVFLSWIEQAVLFGTVLAAITLVLTALLRRRMNPALEAALWTVVLLKFLIPVGPGWSCSLANLCEALRQAPPVQTTLHTISTASSVGHTFADVVPTSTAAQPLGAVVAQANQSWTTLLAGVYLACIAALLICRIRGYRKLRSRCIALPSVDAGIHTLVADVCRQLGVSRPPMLRVGDDLGPFVIGFLRPILVLPTHSLARRGELQTVVVHEAAHLRRGDIFVRQLQWISGTLLFFWPVVAWVNRRIDLARESACDEWALRHGKLTPGEYARCVLNAARSTSVIRAAFHPAGMASKPKNIERRINMILKRPARFSTQGNAKWYASALLAIWCGFVLGGTVDAVSPGSATSKAWPATEEAVKTRAAEVYDLVAPREGADFSGDGVVSYLEKDTYLVGVAMRNAESFMTEFPYADRNHSGTLDILEAKGVLRAITLIAYADRRPEAAEEPVLALEFCHAALDAQQWLLSSSLTQPTHEELDNIWSILVRVRAKPGSYSIRMFDHGAPATDLSRKHAYASGPRYQELENNITVLEAKLAGEQDPDEVAKLRLMLEKLEALLVRLEGS